MVEVWILRKMVLFPFAPLVLQLHKTQTRLRAEKWSTAHFFCVWTAVSTRGGKTVVGGPHEKSKRVLRDQQMVGSRKSRITAETVFVERKKYTEN